jgi:PAS domain S-box-containing protein
MNHVAPLASASADHAEPDFQLLFEATPTPFLVVSPELVIVAVNDAYLRATHTTRPGLLGLGIFDAFPHNPHDPMGTGPAALRASLVRALQTGVPDRMPIQKYDIRVLSESGVDFEARYWSPVNTPVLNKDGDVACIIHRVEDVTAFMHQQIRVEEITTEHAVHARQMKERIQFAELFQQAPAFMALLTGPEHRVDFVNPAYLRLIGYRDIIGQPFADGLPDAAAQGYVDLLDNIYRTGKPFAANGARYSFRTEPGAEATDRFIDFVFQPIMEDGHVGSIFVQGVDVTERVFAETRRDALVKLTDEVRGLKTVADIAFKACQVLGQTLRVSRTGYGTIDHPAESLHVHRDWNGPGIETLAGTLDLRDFGTVIEDMKQGRFIAISDVEKDSRTSPAAAGLKSRSAAAFVGVPIIEADELVAVMFVNHAAVRDWSPEDLLFIREVAERTRTASERLRNELALRESEAKFRTITNAMPQMAWSTRPDGYHDYYNQQWYDFTGVTAGSTDGHEWNEIFHPDDKSRSWKRWRHSLETGDTYEIQYRLRHRSGEYRWVLGRALPVRDDAGSIIRWMGTCTDIHSQKLAEEALRADDRRKDEFLAMLAHELRNPLAPIGAAAELLQMARLDEPRVRQTSEIIGRQVRHMTSLIDDLLDVSRVTRGLVKLDVAPVDIAGVVAEAVEQVNPGLRARHHHLTMQMPPESAIVMGDRKRLVQVIANILNNAVKYTNEGGHIVLAIAADASRILIHVSDNGIGMTPELVLRAFDLFAQAERSPDRSSGGLGLGLALVRSLVELHGGTASCSSDGMGRGSTFTVCLPRLAETDCDPLQNSGDDIMAPPARPLRIMVVDDNKDAAAMLAMLLETTGHEVMVEHGAQQALARARAEAPEVILLDIGLPEMDGNEVARRLRQQAETVNSVLVAVTGYGQAGDRNNALASGFDHHFVKPVDIRKLISLLADIRSA